MSYKDLYLSTKTKYHLLSIPSSQKEEIILKIIFGGADDTSRSEEGQVELAKVLLENQIKACYDETLYTQTMKEKKTASKKVSKPNEVMRTNGMRLCSFGLSQTAINLVTELLSKIETISADKIAEQLNEIKQLVSDKLRYILNPAFKSVSFSHSIEKMKLIVKETACTLKLKDADGKDVLIESVLETKITTIKDKLNTILSNLKDLNEIIKNITSDKVKKLKEYTFAKKHRDEKESEEQKLYKTLINLRTSASDVNSLTNEIYNSICLDKYIDSKITNKTVIEKEKGSSIYKDARSTLKSSGKSKA